MIVRVNHPDISENEKSYLSVASVASATTLTVQNVEGFSLSNYLVLGKLGEEKTELVQIHSSTAISGSVITLASAILFDHAVNTPVTYVAFNKVDIHSATSKTGTYAVCSGSPVAIEVDQEFTEFDDTVGGSTTWYKVRYYNSTGATYSTFSDLVQGTGYTDESLKKIIDKANALTNDKKNKLFTEDEKVDIVNDGYRTILNRVEKADHKRFVKKGYADIKNSYNTGTVSVTTATTTVTGSGTAWDTNWAGKKIVFGDEGFPYEIASVASGTSLTLTRAYLGDGTSLSGASYQIFQDEYQIYDESTGLTVTDFKKVEQVVDEDNMIVNEYDLHRTERGYYLKREGSSLKLCLNFAPSTANDEGRWTVWYRYQPARLDSMADEPEFPLGYAGLLVAYLAARILERAGDMQKAAYYQQEFTAGHNKLIKEIVPRTNERKGFRIDRNLRAGTEHDADWVDDIFSRKTIGT